MWRCARGSVLLQALTAPTFSELNDLIEHSEHGQNHFYSAPFCCTRVKAQEDSAGQGIRYAGR